MQIHRLVAAGACAGVLATGLAAARLDDQQVLRAGAHLVQVDAYPLKDGAPIAGLTAADFPEPGARGPEGDAKLGAPHVKGANVAAGSTLVPWSLKRPGSPRRKDIL